MTEPSAPADPASRPTAGPAAGPDTAELNRRARNWLIAKIALAALIPPAAAAIAVTFLV